MCRGMKIHILDLNSFADAYSYPRCEAEQLVVADAGIGTVYLNVGEHQPELNAKHNESFRSVHHKFGTHSAPWLLAQVGCSC